MIKPFDFILTASFFLFFSFVLNIAAVNYSKTHELFHLFMLAIELAFMGFYYYTTPRIRNVVCFLIDKIKGR